MKIIETIKDFLAQKEGLAVFDEFVLIDRKMFDEIMAKVKGDKTAEEVKEKDRSKKIELVDIGLIFGNTPTLSECNSYLIDEEAAELNDMMDKIRICRKAIREKHPKGNEFVEGVIDCPICITGKRWFMISDHYNGHIHSSCTTENCIKWCE